jgi:MoaA/NifB/PqqE/SkfB family radical SAM enzyme
MPNLILDGSKIEWHMDRVEAWERGERVAPITIDMALTRACDASCHFCYAMLQENDRHDITQEVMADFLEDCAKMGVRGISLVSDGESLISPVFEYSVTRGHALGISMASGTNGHRFNQPLLESVLPCLTYLRFNVSAGTKDRYCDIMGVKPAFYDRVIRNIQDAVRIKKEHHLDVTLGIQMVLMPEDSDQIIPFAELGKNLGVDYAVIKHCSDDEYGGLGVEYSKYNDLSDLLSKAESISTDEYQCVVKWSKIQEEGKRDYQRCYGPPFLIQLSGSGLVAPCGMLFNDRYAKFHIGNICEERWYDIWQSERYWRVMNHLKSTHFNAQQMCGTLCIQHKTNQALDRHMQGVHQLAEANGSIPEHVNFI